MTIANKITLFRIMLIPVFMVFMLSKNVLNAISVQIDLGVIIAGVIFIVAAISDTIDGYVARSRGEVTTMGQLLDPLADKLLVSAALISLVDLGRLSAWIAMIIIGREFSVMGIRMMASAQHILIPASRLGKFKTIAQILAIVSIIFKLPIGYWQNILEWTLLTIAVVLTIMSGLDYFNHARPLLFAENEGRDAS